MGHERVRFPGRPEMELPDGYIGNFVGRAADKYGNYHFGGWIVRGKIAPESEGSALKVIEVIEPDSEKFPWRTVMLDSFFETDDLVGEINNERQQKLWEEYKKSDKYLASLPK